MRHVLVTGASTALGQALVERVRATAGVEEVTGHDVSETRPQSGPAAGRWSADHGDFTRILRENQIDTVLHGALAPDRTGSSTEPSGGDVIGTMSLCAALSDRSLPVRSLVVVSSSAVYPVRSYTPLLHREDGETEKDESSLAASLLEAEAYARNLAGRSPHLNVAILRFAEIAGPGVRGPLSSLLKRSVVPAAVGFDPLVQFLHVEDALRALLLASQIELAGSYNVASAGALRWSDATKRLGKTVVPVVPLAPGPLEPVLRTLRVPHLPNELSGLLRFGLAMDTAKFESAGFTPEFGQTDCVESLRGSPGHSRR